MSTVKGYIEKIKYRNEENGYCVLSVYSEGLEYIIVGYFNYIDEGEYIEAVGDMKLHPMYGEQLVVKSYEIKAPDDIKSIEKYLASGAIKGIGALLAARIVKHFKSDTLRIMEEEPERLSEVKGISERIAVSIGEQIIAKKDMRDAMIFLQKYGIGMNLAIKIYKEYGQRLYSIIVENPYRMADDISGIGFKIADDIASKVGIYVDSEYRIKSGIIYVLTQATLQGHTYLPMEELLCRARELLGIEKDNINEYLTDMQIEKRIVIKNSDTGFMVYLSKLYYIELNIAKCLYDLNIKSEENIAEIEEAIKKIEDTGSIELDALQRQAVISSASSGLLVITGGPGTGKTTVINTIIKYFENRNMQIALAAPTGRAAKRMTETTGHEARTIHRLLEINGAPKDSDENIISPMRFERNDENPLEAEVVIIDEMSMVDIHLMYSLLKAVSVGTRLILVGDVNQLPSVGAGNVLRDIIDSEKFNVVRLNKIYRQAAQSDIVMNAHNIIDGTDIDLSKRSKDFLFIRSDNPDNTVESMLALVMKKLPGYVNADMREIQVLTPMRKGILGVERLNTILQKYLNPPEFSKDEKEIGSILYRVGDKVMQTKNNYQMEWEIRNNIGIVIEKGIGVYNGDIGIIREINTFSELISIEYDDGKICEYTYSDMEEIELAYAITIHKSQGSEYPAIVIPVYSGPRMLMSRNLIYTAVTRAKECVVLLGMPDDFYSMVNNDVELKRFSGLKDRILELDV